VKMGPSRASHIFLISLALTALFAVSSAQNAPVLDPPMEMITDGKPLRDNVLLFPLFGQQSGNKINGLLGLSKFWSRQQEVACATNYTSCQGTQFCCPNGNVCCSGGGTCCGAGTYCTTIGGVQGCCKLGHICNQITDQCTVTGQQRCPNDNFCCPAGDTCYRDANNNPRCSSVALSSSSSVSLSTLTSTVSSVSSKPSHSGTVPTPVSDNRSLQTLCQLKSTNPQGFLSRRRRAPAHPGPKRRGWF